MAEEQTKEEQIDAKFRKAVEAATKNGETTVIVTLAGDGEIHDGKSPTGRLSEGDELVTTPEIAFNLTKRGFVSPKRAGK